MGFTICQMAAINQVKSKTHQPLSSVEQIHEWFLLNEVPEGVDMCPSSLSGPMGSNRQCCGSGSEFSWLLFRRWHRELSASEER